VLRAWWREGSARGKMLPHGWLFPGQDPVNPLSTRQLNRACHAAAEKAGIAKRVSLHTLRHTHQITCSGIPDFSSDTMFTLNSPAVARN